MVGIGKRSYETSFEVLPDSKKPKTMESGFMLFGVYITATKPEESLASGFENESNSDENKFEVIEAPIEAVPLRMHDRNQTDQCTIKKVLVRSDLHGHCRMALKKKEVETYILPKLSDSEKELVKTAEGVAIKVWDCDTGFGQEVILKQWWDSNKGYGIMKHWNSDFVRRRGLQVGDEVGFYWDNDYNGLIFSVLKRKI